MKIASVITTIILLLCPLTAAAQESDSPVITQTAEQQQALQEFIRLQREFIDSLPGIRNQQTADAAAATFRRNETRLSELRAALAEMEPESYLTTLNDARIGYKYTKNEVNRLLLADFYGSTALAEAMMESPVYALPAQELPADMRQQLEKTVQDTLRLRVKLGQMLQGGPGFTQETAWQLTQAPDIQLTETCSVLAGYLFPNTNMLESAGLESAAVYSEKFFTADKALIRLCVDIIPTGEATTARYRFNQWFDVSAIVPFRSQAELDEAVARLLCTLQQLSELADGIRDQATADAAAERIAELIALGRQQAVGLRWLTEDEFAQLVSKDGTSPMEHLISPFLKLQEVNYFDSDKLKHTLQQAK